MNKFELRKINSLLRKSLNQVEASEKIVLKIKSLSDFLNAKNILIFYPLKFEINLLELLKVEGKNFYLPKVKEDYLEICPYGGELIKGAFNIMEPLTKPVLPSVIDLAFVPALAADKDLNRLGYGKGYYDRLFSNPLFVAKKIAVINKELVVDKVPTDNFDIKVDAIITD